MNFVVLLLYYNIILLHVIMNLICAGAGHYVYPGANHTRFDHSVGYYNNNYNNSYNAAWYS